MFKTLAESTKQIEDQSQSLSTEAESKPAVRKVLDLHLIENHKFHNKESYPKNVRTLEELGFNFDVGM